MKAVDNGTGHYLLWPHDRLIGDASLTEVGEVFA